MLMSDFKHDYVRAVQGSARRRRSGAGCARCSTRWTVPGARPSGAKACRGDAVELRAALDLRYIGQWHELTVAVELPLDVDAAAAAFHAEHDRHFGHASPGAPIELLALRLGAVGRTAEARAGRRPGDRAADARRGQRPVWDATRVRASRRRSGTAGHWRSRRRSTARRSSSSRAPRSSCRAASRSPSTPTARSWSSAASAAPRSPAASRAWRPADRRGPGVPGSVAAWKRAPGRHSYV